MSSEYPPLPVSLKGENVQLLPLRAEHLSGLQEAVSDGELWKLWYTFIPTPDKMEAWIRKAREEEDARVSLPFVVQSKEGKILGSTRYMNIEKDARRLEIGTTWYAKSVQRTPVNTECKLLLLQHAFETLNCIAVEFRTNYFNFPSRKAIERLGAKLDGILRNHRWNSNGTLRDTAVYSILQSEWPTVKNNLRFKLDS
ncbi:N-acetyltransferase [Leptospira wolffii]|uniref:GNAT family N-acetyltransferase n=1 Tax=Leptospira wolffii TaxID=409998 RepID=UPI001082D0B7|nr:GNAT family protein [Leptospira wolffii]TGK62360.1 N-acetyltransferase [Leptospira wolffii]TGK68123.1 N-acetyltransferase [Leptospira wolffii]TGK74256.1 N-acetyltransferase [Leptospira wolffii]TGL32169.1 N-acetyltransferase [Leptospira wolffii]